MNFKKRFILSIRWVFIVFLVGCATMYNPATGRQEFIVISTDEEVAMGRDIHAQLMNQYKLSSDEAQTKRLERIGQRVARVSDRQDYQYRFYLIEQDELNAFTVPGGSIYFFTGLMKRLKSDDEIAAVLAHEIGHCSARHAVKKFQAALGYNLVGSLVIGQIGGGLAQQVASLGANAVMQIVFSAYGRKDEHQADKLGVKYLYLSGYDLDGIVKTLEVLKQESKGDKTPLILRSHPYLDDRIAAVKKEIKDIKASGPAGQ